MKDTKIIIETERLILRELTEKGCVPPMLAIFDTAFYEKDISRSK